MTYLLPCQINHDFFAEKVQLQIRGWLFATLMTKHSVQFLLGDDDADVWTGAKDLKNNGTYLFTQTNTQLDLDNLPFGLGEC